MLAGKTFFSQEKERFAAYFHFSGNQHGEICLKPNEKTVPIA
ncbi:hypothetical protein ABVF61_01685 [Roseibium sp. HPY-6]